MRAGVLIIGSLLWDNEHRATWRVTRLRMEERIPVRVPIRYGRRSRTRGNTFTMVFRDDESLGQAVVMPCVFPVTSIEDLSEEASALWKAEQPSADEGEVGSSWGCVGVLLRDKNLRHFVRDWGRYFQAYSKGPVSPVDDEGILNIPWPVKLDNFPLSEVDILLSTSTQANRPLPTAIEIADAWINQNEGHERYFFENVRHSIRTAEDLDIWRRIEERSPEWLKNPDYADVISLLHSEAAHYG